VPTPRDITLRSGDVRLLIDLDAGGRCEQLTIGDLDVLGDGDRGGSQFHWGSFVMAPWAGRIRHGRFSFDGQQHQLPVNWATHAIHGTVVDRPWWVAEATSDSVVLDCPLDDRWPWRGYVRQIISLGESQADFRIEVHSDDDPFPASAGWHPWFRRRLGRGEALEIALDAEAMLRRDDDGIPTGDLVPIPDQPWDDCFDQVHWPVTLSWPGALRLDVSGDTRYGVVYTEPTEAICVEPQTGPPDAMTLDPVVVAPGQPLAAAMSWTWAPTP
jgi:aldose 1-epimerase